MRSGSMSVIAYKSSLQRICPPQLSSSLSHPLRRSPPHRRSRLVVATRKRRKGLSKVSLRLWATNRAPIWPHRRHRTCRPRSHLLCPTLTVRVGQARLSQLSLHLGRAHRAPMGGRARVMNQCRLLRRAGTSLRTLRLRSPSPGHRLCRPLRQASKSSKLFLRCPKALPGHPLRMFGLCDGNRGNAQSLSSISRDTQALPFKPRALLSSRQLLLAELR